jgi:hypothetical protein
MIVFDPLYGQFELSSRLWALVQTPEVRRLSQIRLLNTVTPSLATLGEIRRFSHTLGILYLVSQSRQMAAMPTINAAFSAAVLLHDIGTPPFAHLLEYHLKERTGWTHENVIKAILYGHHVPENRASQLFARSVIRFRAALAKSRIDSELVEQIVTGEHEYSPLLFGTLDFDNLDNVARMGWALGIDLGLKPAVRIAEDLRCEQRVLLLPKGLSEHVRLWLQARRAAYDIIVFDGPTVAAQAVLSSVLSLALMKGVISEHDWVLSDEALLDVLLKDSATKKVISAQYLGTLPRHAFSLQIHGQLHELNGQTRTQIAEVIKDVLESRFGQSCYGYVFLDNGTFEKELAFVDPATGESWTCGRKSQSVVLYGFVRSQSGISHNSCLQAAEDVLQRLRISSDRVLRCIIGDERLGPDGQQNLNLAASTD